jgi:hypothetical protein
LDDYVPISYNWQQSRSASAQGGVFEIEFTFGTFSVLVTKLILEPWSSEHTASFTESGANTILKANVQHYRDISSRDTGDNSAVQFLATQLKICQEQHTVCAANGSNQTFRPTRLLDVGSLESRLIHLYSGPSASPYIALLVVHKCELRARLTLT